MNKKKDKYHSVYVSPKNNCLFPEQFESWEKMDWNDDMPPFFKRLNKIDDDRSFVILATSVLEYQIERFLEVFIPKSNILVNKHTSLSMKINLIKAFNLIPPQFPIMLDCLRNIRNDFAHNLEIDGFNDAEKSEKLLIHIKELKRLWNIYSEDMCYWCRDEPLRKMFKDVWRVSVEGLRVYESNVKLFRQETEKKEFIEQLSKLSEKLKNKKKKTKKNSVMKN